VEVCGVCGAGVCVVGVGMGVVRRWYSVYTFLLLSCMPFSRFVLGRRRC
jgi:hypothetical protein